MAKNKTSSKEAHRLRVQARRLRQTNAQQRRRDLEAREAAIRAALARPPSDLARRTAERDRQPQRIRQYPPRMQQLVDIARARAPRLLTDDTVRAFRVIAQLVWIRPLVEWQPTGKGHDTLFKSLAEHLFARFPMPSILWTVFSDTAPGTARLARIVAHVAAGGSFFDTVRSGLLPVPLTRRMCHEILTRPGAGTFLAAIRRSQVRAAGGSLGLSRAWVRTSPGRQLHERGREQFWHSVIAWLCRNPAPHAEVGPLVDYIEHRRAEDGAFSMKRRSLAALQRGMREWHRDLGRRASVRQVVFRRSGFLPLDIARKVRDSAGRPVREVWHFREVIDTNALADEGRAMGHCVYSYVDRIASGACSIWTLTLEDGTGHWRRLTIEVRTSMRRIVQVRGRFNKPAEARDVVALREWAGRNNLEIGSGP